MQELTVWTNTPRSVFQQDRDWDYNRIEGTLVNNPSKSIVIFLGNLFTLTIFHFRIGTFCIFYYRSKIICKCSWFADLGWSILVLRIHTHPNINPLNWCWMTPFKKKVIYNLRRYFIFFIIFHYLPCNWAAVPDTCSYQLHEHSLDLGEFLQSTLLSHMPLCQTSWLKSETQYVLRSHITIHWKPYQRRPSTEANKIKANDKPHN